MRRDEAAAKYQAKRKKVPHETIVRIRFVADAVYDPAVVDRCEAGFIRGCQDAHRARIARRAPRRIADEKGDS
jgi:hypothetical protein